MSQLSLLNLEKHPLVQRITRLRARVRVAVSLRAAGLILASVLGAVLLLLIADYLLTIPAFVRGALLLLTSGPATPFLLVSSYLAIPALILAFLGAISAVAIDRSLDLTNQRRAHISGIILTASLGILGYLIWRHLLRPMSMRLTDQFLASRIENQNRELSDELISAVNFIHHRTGNQNAMVARHIDLAGQRTEHIRFEDAVDFRRGFAALAVAAAILALAGGMAALSPALARIGLQRWFTSADARWPHSTNVDFVWHTADGLPPKALPAGETYTFHAVIDKGGPARVLLTSRTDTTDSASNPMTQEKADAKAPASANVFYHYDLKPEGSKVTLRLQAGDDNDVPPLTLPISPRPVITQIKATVYPPPYVRDVKDPSKPAAPLIYNLQTQAGHAAVGSLVSLDIKSSKPFDVNARGEPNVGFYLGEDALNLPLHRALISPTEAQVTFTANESIQAQLRMIDNLELVSRTGGTVNLLVLPDTPPTVSITEPRNSVDRAPEGFVELSVEGSDDWGFNHLWYFADNASAALGDPHVFQTSADMPWQELTVDAASGTTTGRTKYTWNLAPLHLEPGATLLFYANVQDNFASRPTTHDWLNVDDSTVHHAVKSSPLLLRIRSAGDIIEQNRKALSDINDRIRSLKNQQDQTRLQTDAIRKIVDGAKSISPAQQGQLADLAQQQAQESVAANSIKDDARRVADELRQNNMQDKDLSKIAQDVAAGMSTVGTENMPQAGSQLKNASQNGVPQSAPNAAAQNAQQSAQSMSGATQQQDKAIAKMDELMKQLGAVGDFESLRNETTKILDQQRNLTQRTQAIAPETLGLTRDKLPADVRDKEDKLAAEQQALSQRMADLLDRMDRASQALSQSDQASAQSLQNASSIGKSTGVGEKQQSAASNISTNETSNAGNDQQTAQQGLQNMIDELNKNDQRRLEQLAREVRELLAEVQQRRDEQAAINTETASAGAAAAKPALLKIAEHQGNTQQNTIITEKKAESTRDAAQAAAYIQEAVDHMGESATVLYGAAQAPAIKPEADSLAALDAAIAELKKLRDRISPDPHDKQLSEFIKQYQAIQDDQKTLKTTADGLEARRLASDDKEFTHQDDQAIGGLAKSQGGLTDRINALSKDPDLAQVDVIVWMNEQVAESMDASKALLAKEKLGTPADLAQQAAIDRIQLIIEALKEEQQKPSEFNSPGGGGGGGGGKPPLVPPMAQLKLLKAMQIVVNDQTKTVDQQLKAATTDADKNDMQTQAQDLGAKEGRIHDMASDIVDQLVNKQQPPASQPATRNAP